MRRLFDHQLQILASVEMRGRVCMGAPSSPNAHAMAAELRQLAKWKYLIEDGSGDDGPVYSLSEAGQEKLE